MCYSIRSDWIHNVLIIGCNCEMNENLRVYAIPENETECKNHKIKYTSVKHTTATVTEKFVYINETFSQATL